MKLTGSATMSDDRSAILATADDGTTVQIPLEAFMQIVENIADEGANLAPPPGVTIAQGFEISGLDEGIGLGFNLPSGEFSTIILPAHPALAPAQVDEIGHAIEVAVGRLFSGPQA